MFMFALTWGQVCPCYDINLLIRQALMCLIYI